MKKITTIALLCTCYVLISSCTKEVLTETLYTPLANTKASSSSTFNDGPMMIGQRLDNPYNVNNMRAAYDSLVKSGEPINVPITIITTTHYHIKFTPKNADEFNDLEEIENLDLFDHPLDCEIITPGSYYREPGLADSVPTPQYTSLTIAEWSKIKKNLNIEYEILDELCIDPVRHVGTFALSTTDDFMTDFDMIVEKSFEITGNAEEAPMTRSSNKWTPSGRITAYDKAVGGQIPIKGVKVVTNTFCNKSVAYTDEQGYFTCSKSYKNKVHYKIIWESTRWDIRDGWLIQAYYNDGQKRNSPWYLAIPNGDNKTLRYSVIHRALYRYYYGDNLGLLRPSNQRKEKIAYLHKAGNEINGDYWLQLGAGVLPDIRIYGKSSGTGDFRGESELFRTMCHELGHASHYTNSFLKFCGSDLEIIESWANCTAFILTEKEYTELDVIDVVFPSENFKVPIRGGISTIISMIIPNNINRQQWRKNSNEYTPLFIDLYDDINQRDYYYYYNENHNTNIDISSYPNDNVHINNAPLIENIAINSKSFSEVKTKLLQKITDGSLKNVSTSSINTLFESYE